MIRKIKNHPKFDNLLNLGKLVSSTAFTEAGIKGVGFISGIIVIRLLPVEEYALYTLANSFLGAMTVLANSGISAGVMAEGGKVWKDKEKLGRVVATGLDLRRKFAVGTLIVMLPMLVYFLNKHDASWIFIALICMSIIPAFYAGLSDTLLQIPPKLHQDVSSIQKNQLAVGTVRLTMNAGLLFIFPFTFIALFASGIPRVYGNIKLREIASPYADYNLPPDKSVRKEILSVVKKIMPAAIYYSISGQLIVFLISIFGETSSIAELGALSRFSLVFSIFLSLNSKIFTPRFSRLKSRAKIVSKKLFQIQILLCLISAGAIMFFWIFSEQFLWILGDEYSDLNFELVLILVSGAVAFLSESTHSLLSSRGIVVPPAIYIFTAVMAQVIAAYTLPIGELVGVITFSIWTVLVVYIMQIIYFLYSVKSN